MKIQFIFFEGKSLLSQLVKFFTRSNFSHVAYLHPDGYLIEAWPENSRNLLGAKWRISSFDDHTKGTRYKIVSKETDKSIRVKELFEFVSFQRVPYDYLGLISFVIPFRLSINGHWFCSEGCYEVLRYVGLMPLEIPGWKMNPDDFYNLLEVAEWEKSDWMRI
jgi:hypothetical protein